MRKFIFFTIFSFAFALIFFPSSAKAAPILTGSYELLDFESHAIPGTSNAFVSVSGHVTAVPGADPSTAHLFFKYRKADFSNALATDTFFTPQSTGDFTNTIGTNNPTPFICQQDYLIWLYENNSDLIQATFNGGAPSPTFQVTIDCTGAPVAGDMFAPDSAGTEVLHGVNFGTVTTTSNSININNGHLIPFIPNGPKSFKIEYGRGVSGGALEPIGFSPVFTKNPPNYSFNLQINVPLPNTSYYFTIWEVNGNNSTNLLTYNYATTPMIDGASVVHYNFTQENSIKIFGNLINGNNPLLNFPIDIVIRNANGQDLMTAEEVASDAFSVSGSAYFEHLFFGLSNSGLTAGNTYSIVIKGTVTGTDLTTPITFTLPSPNNPNPNPNPNPNQGQNGNPPTSGLLACEGPNCDFDGLIATINNFVNFLIVFVAFPVVAIVIAWAGVLLLTSGGNSSKKEHAKSMITHVVIGLVIALLAWAIIKLILIVFGYVPTGPLWSVLNTTPN